MSFALDVTALILGVAAASCAWRSCRWLAGVAARADAEVASCSGLGAASLGVATLSVLDGAPDNAPLVSLLVPARDEERNVGACLEGMLAQRGVRCEVLLLDDGSRDATRAIATQVLAAHAAWGADAAAAAGGTRHDVVRASSASPVEARLLEGRPLPDGWGGKCFACQQLADAAHGEWLFFLDADTRLAPDAVQRALASARAAGVDFASFLPRYVGDGWPNRLVVPWLYYFLTALVPLPEVPRVKHPRLSVANGQAMLVRRDAYARLGGHAAVRDHIVEDVSLAIAAKTAGLRLALLDGHRWLACEMYDGGRAMAAGFAKSFHSAARRYPLQWGALLTLLALMGLRPWVRVLLAPSFAERALALVAIVVVGATYAGLLARFRQRLVALAAWPPALWSLLGIAVSGGVSGLLGRELAWRGRPVGGRAPS
ncbi:glycosyltransferase [Candidatus Binatia bacterium]|nr:glycosyltransferase [Candidatus Binatia bacterium]